MRLRNLLLVATLIAVAASGCSRLTFVRPKGGIREFDAPKSEYRVSDSKATRQRLEEQDSLGLAEQRLRVGDLKTAEQEASKVLRRNPGSVGALTLLAIVADRRGQSKAAGAYYRKAAELAPNDGGMLNNYGAWLCGNGFPAEALVWFDRAIAAPNYNPAAPWPMPAAAHCRPASTSGWKPTCARRWRWTRPTRTPWCRWPATNTGWASSWMRVPSSNAG